MEDNKSTKRILEIINRLNNGEIVCVKQLAEQYEKNERTPNRDIKLIKEIFGDILIKVRTGCYQALNKIILEDTLSSTELYMLKNIWELSERSQLSLSKGISKDVKKALRKDENKSPYLFKQKPYEEIFKYSKKFKFLEHAIKFRKEIEIEYPNKQDKMTKLKLKPYKIVFVNENFYLASVFQFDKDDQIRLTMSRIALIDTLNETGKTFNHLPDVNAYIDYMQTPWANYQPNFREHLIEVIVTIPKEQARYFKLKKFLASQKILDEDEKGTLTLSYKVSSEIEIETLIKQWIPYMKVLEPESLVNKFKNLAKEFYLNFK